MAKIPVSPNRFAIIDDEDLAVVGQYHWSMNRNGYPHAKINGKSVQMHALIFHVEDGMCRDHKNRDRLDNRKANLRVATPLQNSQNAGIRSDNTSGFKGVYWNKQYKKWKSQIRHAGKRIFLGRYENPMDAAKAYDNAAKQYFGEFAVLNLS